MQLSLTEIVVLLSCMLTFVTDGLLINRIRAAQSRNHLVGRTYGKFGGQSWQPTDLDMPNLSDMNQRKIESSVVLKHLGDIQQGNNENPEDNAEKREYNRNVGKALEVLRRQLPMVFYTTNLDFSIFAPYITVVDFKQHKMGMKKSIYSAAVKSMKPLAAISSMYPSMNVRKIEYLDECRTIQCLVDVVLPDSVRIDGKAVWEGMFYFGINKQGLIDSHIFDQKISTMTPSKAISANTVPGTNYPWIKAKGPQWSPDLIPNLVPQFSHAGLADVIDFDLSEDELQSLLHLASYGEGNDNDFVEQS